MSRARAEAGANGAGWMMGISSNMFLEGVRVGPAWKAALPQPIPWWDPEFWILGKETF